MGNTVKQTVLLGTFYRSSRERIGTEEIAAHRSFYCLNLLWLEAAVRSDPEISASVDVVLEIFNQDDPMEWNVASAWAQKPAIVGLSCNMSNIVATMDFCRRLRLVLPEVMIVLGGPEACDYLHLLERHPYVDVVVLGEGEAPFVSIVKAWMDDSPPALHGIPGIAFRGEDGICATEDSAAVSDLSALPSPFTPERIAEMSGLVQYGTSRGCPHSCAFCRWQVATRRFLPMEQVERELGAMLDNPRIRVITLTDAEMDLRTQRSRHILEFIFRRNTHGTKFRGFFHCLSFDREVLELSRAAGFLDPFAIGLQSASPRKLELAGRNWYSLKQFEAALPLLSQFYPRTGYDVIYGLPGDDYESFKETLRWCLERGLGHLVLHRLMVVPGTELQKHSERYGLTYDREVPHFVYSSDSYSYSELLKMDALAVSFQVLMSVLHPEDYVFLQECQVDLIQIMERAPEEIPNWHGYYGVRDEIYVENINVGILEPVLDLIRSSLNDDHAALKLANRVMSRRALMDSALAGQPYSTAPDRRRSDGDSASAPIPSRELMRLAEEIVKPWQVGQGILAEWLFAEILIESFGEGCITYVFRWQEHPLHLKVVRRDDSQPRLGHGQNTNIFYSPQQGDEAIPTRARDALFSAFIARIRQNDPSSSIWPWPRRKLSHMPPSDPDAG